MEQISPNGGIGDAKVVQLFTVPQLVFGMESWIMTTSVTQPDHLLENLSTTGMVILLSYPECLRTQPLSLVKQLQTPAKMILDQGRAQDKGLMMPDLSLEEMINLKILTSSNQQTYKVVMIQDITVINLMMQDLIPTQTLT